MCDCDQFNSIHDHHLTLYHITDDPLPSASFISTQSTVVLSTSSSTLHSQTMTSLAYYSPIISTTGLYTSTVISTETNKGIIVIDCTVMSNRGVRLVTVN